MNAGFPLHAVACGQPRKCVLQWREFRRRGRKVQSAINGFGNLAGVSFPVDQARFLIFDLGTAVAKLHPNNPIARIRHSQRKLSISHAVRGLKRVYYRLPSLCCPNNMPKSISPLPHLCSRPPSKDIRKDIAGIIIQGISDPDNVTVRPR